MASLIKQDRESVYVYNIVYMFFFLLFWLLLINFFFHRYCFV